jgi:hypothetical protein
VSGIEIQSRIGGPSRHIDHQTAAVRWNLAGVRALIQRSLQLTESVGAGHGRVGLLVKQQARTTQLRDGVVLLASAHALQCIGDEIVDVVHLARG